MKIYSIQLDKVGKEKQRAELVHLLNQPSFKEKRVCQNCTMLCPCEKRSNRCCCACSPDCPDAPLLLSSDPMRYPIEPKIIHLVFSLAELRLVPPCWSCEGHLGTGNSLLRVPQVWFYSGSVLYPKLIAEYLAQLLHQERIRYEWLLTVSPYSECDTTMFKLYPENDKKINDHTLYLAELQDDIKEISRSLVRDVRNLAGRKHNK